jgi:YkoY family integral membrane protein
MELFLSADNAIVLGLLTHKLPERLRKKALYIGVISAFVLRAIGILCVAFLIQYTFLQLLGGLYLVYLSVHHFLKGKTQRHLEPKASPSFWKTVLWVELFDFAFAFDSIIAAVAFLSANTTQDTYRSKIWIVYVGGILGLLGIRWAASLLSRLIHQFPRLETSAYLMVGLIGAKLCLQGTFHGLPAWTLGVYWICLGLCIVFGFTKRVKG